MNPRRSLDGRLLALVTVAFALLCAGTTLVELRNALEPAPVMAQA